MKVVSSVSKPMDKAANVAFGVDGNVGMIAFLGTPHNELVDPKGWRYCRNFTLHAVERCQL